MDASKYVSAKFANMNFAAALAVVYMHCGFGGRIEFWTNQILTNGLFRVAVPFFFMASGFFLAEHIGENCWWKTAIIKRVRSIVVPFWIWNFAAWLTASLVLIASNLFLERPLWFGFDGWLSSVLRIAGFNNGWTPNGPLWFIRALMICVIFSPIINWLSKKSIGWGILIAFYVVFDWQDNLRTNWPLLVSVVSWEGFVYFAFGMWLNRKSFFFDIFMKIDYKTFLVIGILGVVLILTKALTVNVYQNCKYIPFKILFVPIVMAFVFRIMPSKRWPVWALNVSFPMYLIHSIVIYIGRFAFNRSENGWLYHLALFFATIILVFACAYILRKVTPKFAQIAFGGR